MSASLEGRVALVTGATRLRGIGAAIARTLAADGAKLLLHVYRPYDAAQPWGVEPDEPERLAAELAARTEIELVELDLAQPESALALVERARERFGRLDILINNAACSERGELPRLDADQLDRHYEVNLRAPALLCREFARIQSGPGGRIVNLTSGQGLTPMPQELAYAATKGGLEALTTSLAPWLATRGIRIYAVDPGPTDTGWISDALRAELLRQPGGIRTPEEVARVVRPLVSDEAGDSTGQIIRVRASGAEVRAPRERAGVALRRSTPDDLESFRECLDAVARERRWLAFVGAPPLEAVRSYLESNPSIQFVAVADGRVAGWCDVTPNVLEGFRHACALGMGLLPAFRGQGLGRALLEQTLAAAREVGLTRIELEVFASNTVAIALYERFGFAHEGRKRSGRLLDGRVEDIVCMALTR